MPNRFSVDDEVVFDNGTGLMWTKSAAISEFPLTWSEAFALIETLNRSEIYGYSDWKLPNRKELFSLMSHETVNPSLPPSHPFTNVFDGYYWTSTTCARLPNQAWYIHLGGARVFKGMKKNSYMVWPGRVSLSARISKTGQRRCYDQNGKIVDCKNTFQDGEFQSGVWLDGTARFTEKVGVVYDHATGLAWLKNADSIGLMDQSSAYEAAEKMNREYAYGYSDWRLPAITELESLTDMDRHTPALPAGNPFFNVRELYWSSTTSVYDSRYAWVLYLQDGAVGVAYKTLPEFHFWPVRGKGFSGKLLGKVGTANVSSSTRTR
jgi:hypothetical protein